MTTRLLAFSALACVFDHAASSQTDIPCFISGGWRPLRSSSALSAVTPIGPFCPFRSQAANEIEVPMEDLTNEGPAFATAFNRINLDLQMGNTPAKEQLLVAADGLRDAIGKWSAMTTKMAESADFQTREYMKLTEAHLMKSGETVENIVAGLTWQSDCMRAMANNEMPPIPPPGVDLQKLIENAQNSNTPSMAALTSAQRISDQPFSMDHPAFESPLVKEELEKLCLDHNNLIEFGGGYGSFDPLGKLYYLDEIEKIEERWDVFFARFSLLNAIDPAYVKQCNGFLQSMNMNEEGYRDLLKEGHALMRKEAEAERNLIG